MELLRMRAQIERAEVAAAVVDLKDGTRRLRQLGGLASSVANAATGGSEGTFGQIAGAISQRPWIAAAVVGALRTVRRHPWLALVAAGAIVIAARWRWHGPPSDSHPEPANVDAPGPSADDAGG
jgi:hypothetical protein